MRSDMRTDAGFRLAGKIYPECFSCSCSEGWCWIHFSQQRFFPAITSETRALLLETARRAACLVCDAMPGDPCIVLSTTEPFYGPYHQGRGSRVDFVLAQAVLPPNAPHGVEGLIEFYERHVKTLKKAFGVL